MRGFSMDKARPRRGWALRSAAATLLCVSALCQPNFAYAAPHGGGGGFHGGGGFGGFHGGGFHGGGFHGGGFHGGGFHGGGFHGGWHGSFAGLHDGLGHANGAWNHGSHNGSYGWYGDGLGNYSYPGWGYYPDYGYDDYSQPYTSQTWYYCSDPAGYYPYVTQCNTGWQTVPAD